MTGYVGIDFCCNDPDNGLFAGRVEGIQLDYGCGDVMFELEARREPAPKLTEIGGAIRLAGKRWPISGSRDWIGNWCWNRYVFQREVAADFIIWLHARELFYLGTGEQRLIHAWRRPEGLGAFRPFLIAQLAECRAAHG